MRNTREELITAGTELFLRHSYHGTGINEILKLTGIPKGSFYHFFPSKEAFALAVIARHREEVKAFIPATLSNKELPPIERIRAFLERLSEKIWASEFACGCPLGTLGQEMAAVSPSLRDAVATAFAGTRVLLIETLSEGQDDGSIRRDVSAEHVARYLMFSLHGAIIMAKVEQSRKPLELSISLTVEKFLPAPSPS